MRSLWVAIFLCMLSSSLARADELRYRPIARATRGHMLRQGARGLGVTTLFAGVAAGLGALAIAGCSPRSGSDYSDSNFCDQRDASPARGAALGALGSYLLLAPAISGEMMSSAGAEHGRAGSSTATVMAAYAALFTATGLSYGVYTAVDHHDVRVVAPVTSLLVAASLALPIGVGFLVYRWSEPRGFSGKESMSAYLAPAIAPGQYGLGAGARF